MIFVSLFKNKVRTDSLLEATPGFEPGIRVLQTRALPLGYIAIYMQKNGAGNGAQTRDLRVGNATLYQLSYSRKSKQDNNSKYFKKSQEIKPLFVEK